MLGTDDAVDRRTIDAHRGRLGGDRRTLSPVVAIFIPGRGAAASAKDGVARKEVILPSTL